MYICDTWKDQAHNLHYIYKICLAKITFHLTSENTLTEAIHCTIHCTSRGEKTVTKN